ncbi:MULTISPECIES: DUF7114 family protein [Haloarcula]|uniref:Polyprenyl synthetase n=1 Tax=Haloarcula pellucida TaxID=1427151 RepID=A0A830GN91_9EURY|nr:MULTISPECIES: hypothetical protein [Halomicroarcula]MBX0349260.1 hypothetical protein [Halomicroarcula pellucida]MDS0279154.1 hypothetical protein [Halomicroarcula sp. S1AR25-4]GGN99755.1 hypothetical protein GCM10009030_31670 [Halomicroarcula pellucida]
MEEVAAVRQAALAAVDDVEPERLRERITARLDDASLSPGVLTLVSASAAREHPTDPADGDADRAAGVQLIYEGLRLTRQLAHEDPWAGGDRDAADLDILIADILVSRGFYLLARTEAADAAVQVVRSFGHDQTVQRTTGDERLDGTLEVDICELAVVAGVTAGGVHPTPTLREFATDLGSDGLPENGRLVGDEIADALTAHTRTDHPPSDGTEAAADH